MQSLTQTDQAALDLFRQECHEHNRRMAFYSKVEMNFFKWVFYFAPLAPQSRIETMLNKQAAFYTSKKMYHHARACQLAIAEIQNQAGQGLLGFVMLLAILALVFCWAAGLWHNDTLLTVLNSINNIPLF